MYGVGKSKDGPHELYTPRVRLRTVAALAPVKSLFLVYTQSSRVTFVMPVKLIRCMQQGSGFVLHECG